MASSIGYGFQPRTTNYAASPQRTSYQNTAIGTNPYAPYGTNPTGVVNAYKRTGNAISNQTRSADLSQFDPTALYQQQAQIMMDIYAQQAAQQQQMRELLDPSQFSDLELEVKNELNRRPPSQLIYNYGF